MLHGIATLLLCQLAGEVAVRGLGLTLPGPVAGMALLALLMLAIPALAAIVRETAQALLAHLSLLFVPAGTGVVAHLDRLGPDGPALLAALCLSTLAGLTVTVWTFALLSRRPPNGAAAP